MKKFLTLVLATLAVASSYATEISCADAVEIGNGLAVGQETEDEYTVQGYVISVISSITDKQKFWMADNADAEQGIFEAWSLSGEKSVNKGDLVQVVGKISHFKDDKNEVIEMNGGTVIVVTPAPVDENIVVFNSADFTGKGAANPGAEVNIEKNGITLHVDKALGTDYHLRVFKNSVVTINSTKRIVKFAFAFDPYQDTPYDGGLDKEVCVEGTSWTFTASQSQVRFKSITVYLGDETCGVAPVETITVAQAMEIGNALGDNESTKEKYVVEAFVVKAYDYDEQYKNQSFYMSDDASAEHGDFFAKYTTGDIVTEGDKVQVKGQIEKNVKDGKTTIQIFKGVATKAPVGLRNVKSTIKAKKVIENGQFMIEANGVRFNMLGARF